MNNKLQIIILFLNITYISAQTDVYDSIYVGGRWRTFLTHLPTGYNLSANYPLVFAFHGGGAPNYKAIQINSGLSQKADSASFVMVYPEGVKIAGVRTWNAGGCCSPATTLNIDDVGFVNSLLTHLFKTRPIDTTRVYATGFSNGALLCYRLANQLPGRFAAIAPVAGDLVHYPWNPSKEIPIISFHSYKDSNILYFGGVTIGPSGTYFPPQDSIFGIISSDYSCANVKDTLYHDTSKYDHFKYSECSCNSVIEQYVSYDGGHFWPGGEGLGKSGQYSATYLMWQFFQKYTINCQPVPVSSVEVSPVTTSVTVGNTQQLTVTILPADATNKIVNWSTSNPSIATVSASGLITTITEGYAIITATSDADSTKKATCELNVTTSATIGLDKKESVVTIYPNPATDVIYITSTQPMDEIRIVNLTGSVVKMENMEGVHSVMLQLSNLEKGLYVLEISLKDGINIRKTFVIN